MIFDTHPPSPDDGLLIVAPGLGLMLILEIQKMVARRIGWIEELA